MSTIFHITHLPDWLAAHESGEYVHPSLAAEGFIHLSTGSQIVATTERYYADVTGLVLLEIDPEQFPDGRLVWELAPSVGEDFPHSYGPIPADAVVGVYSWDGNAATRTALLDELDGTGNHRMLPAT
jgi:uncharacterized protein (DUF952 family)